MDILLSLLDQVFFLGSSCLHNAFFYQANYILNDSACMARPITYTIMLLYIIE